MVNPSMATSVSLRCPSVFSKDLSADPPRARVPPQPREAQCRKEGVPSLHDGHLGATKMVADAIPKGQLSLGEGE